MAGYVAVRHGQPPLRRQRPVSFRRFFLVRLGWALFGLWLAVTLVFVTTRVLAPPAEVCIFTTSQVACEQTLFEQLDSTTRSTSVTATSFAISSCINRPADRSGSAAPMPGASPATRCP